MKERDTLTNYDYFGARYYDSEPGRWLSLDPMAVKYPGWSPYNYCVNNPLIFIDPNGKDIKCAIDSKRKTISIVIRANFVGDVNVAQVQN